MDIQERQEVREMIHGILSGWNARSESYMETTNSQLEGIGNHLKELNGSVARHQRVLDANIPHTEDHCVQKNKIDSVEKTLIRVESNMITRDVLNTLFWKFLGGVIGVGSLIFAVWELLLKTS